MGPPGVLLLWTEFTEMSLLPSLFLTVDKKIKKDCLPICCGLPPGTDFLCGSLGNVLK